MTDKPWTTGLTTNDLLAMFNANTILKADTDDTPEALTVAEAGVVGRAIGGSIASLTKSQLWTIMEDFASMYIHENATATTIQAVDEWHLVLNFTSGTQSANWGFTSGASKSITAYADNGDGKTQVSSTGHGMSNGDVISIAGTTNYNGVWVIEQVAADTFVINTAYVADDGASTGIYGDFLKSSDAGSTGKYQVAYQLSTTGANSNDILKATIFQNGTELTNLETQRKLASGDYASCSGVGIIDYTDGDRITVAIQNRSGSGNFTLRDANLTIIRVGT